MDSDSSSESSDTEIKSNIEDVLLLNETCTSNKEKKRYYGKKRYKNVKIGGNVEITDQDLEKMIIDDLNGQYYPGYVKYFKSHYRDCVDKSMKNAEKSLEARIEGNKLFTKTTHGGKVHQDIWQLYCKSIAFAPIGTKELVLGYDCRSNLLLHLKMYQHCVKDIDKALELTNFELIKVKLLCRKMTCFVAMGKDLVEKTDLLKNLSDHVERIDNIFKDEKFLKMVEQAKNNAASQPSKTETHNRCLCCPALITCHHQGVDMVFHKEIRAVANRDFAPGDMVVVTKPLVTSFNPSKSYVYCSHCLSFMWAGIPCDECSLCMYCSEECKTEAWNEYHMLECKILPHMNIENIAYNKMHLSLRVLLKSIQEFGSISTLKEKMQEVDKLRDDSKLSKNLFDSKFLQFYASLYTHLISSPCTIQDLTKLAMKACFLVACLIQTCDIFNKRRFKSLRGKELAKEQDVVNLGFVLLKILISNTRNIKAAGQNLTSDDACNKYSTNNECDKKRHCIRGSYYDIYNAIFEKSCNSNVARCWTDEGKIVYYCIQPIKKMEKITVSRMCQFFMNDKAARDTFGYLSVYCQCIACVKYWPVMEKLFEKTKQRRFKIESKESKIVQKYLERNQSIAKYVQPKNCIFNDPEYYQLLQDVKDVVKAYGQPSFASSLMLYYLCITFEFGYGSFPLSIRVPKECQSN